MKIKDLRNEVIDFLSKQKKDEKDYCSECGHRGYVGFLCDHCGLKLITKQDNSSC